MITLKCETKDTALLTAMTPFQGDLKKRTPVDIQNLKESLLTEGLLMPIALWRTEDRLLILDGHGRYEALISAALNMPDILQQEFPVLLIKADNEEDARKALLQITSTYGKINKPGLIKFAAPLVNYKAPIMAKALKPPVIKHDTLEAGDVIVRLKIPKEKAPEFLAIIKDTKWIEVY